MMIDVIIVGYEATQAKHFMSVLLQLYLQHGNQTINEVWESSLTNRDQKHSSTASL